MNVNMHCNTAPVIILNVDIIKGMNLMAWQLVYTCLAAHIVLSNIVTVYSTEFQS